MRSTLETIDVITRFRPEVLAKYDFSKAVYHDALKPMTGIICPKHGPFQQYTSQLRKEGGAGCPACGSESRRETQRGSVDTFIAKAREVHGNEYSYEKAVYTLSANKLTVTCSKHGDFEVTPNNHLKGRGCPDCGAEKRGRNNTPRSTHKPRNIVVEQTVEQWLEKQVGADNLSADERENLVALLRKLRP